MFTNANGSQINFDDITYIEYFSTFRLAKLDTASNAPSFHERKIIANSPSMLVIQRNELRLHLCRLQSIRPSQGEIFYLRTILQHRSALSFEDARTVSNHVYETFQEAANAMGLFANQNEAELAIQEAILTLRTPRQLHVLFVHLLVNDCIVTPLALWNTYSDAMAIDHTLRCGNNNDIGISRALHEIGTLLEEFGQTTSDYGLPEATESSTEILHEILRWGPQYESLSTRANAAYQSMTLEQRDIFDQVIHASLNYEPFLAFIDGKAGRGKTFLVNAICDKLRSVSRIVLLTATAAFAAQLYPGGRTTHSMFKVSVLYANSFILKLHKGTGKQQKRNVTITYYCDRSTWRTHTISISYYLG